VDAAPVETIKSVRYHQGAAGDAFRHQLDIFMPKGKKDCPVVVLVHGGAWNVGDNRCCGLYSSVGEFLASQGIVAVLPNYRLSPHVKHPEHVKDVARAVAWVHEHAADYGGNAGQIFLVGHSAGGHLASLLATDRQYLDEVGRSTKDIKGVISLSGVYEIPAGNLDVVFGGQKDNAVRWDKMFPLRMPSHPLEADLPGIPLSVNIFAPAFGDDPEVRKNASPLHHVRGGLPPFLLLSASNDLPTLPEMAREFHQALCEHGCDAELLVIRDRNHNSILFQAYQPSDPAAQAILSFIRHQNLKGKR
jgi:acetyl esterase/lipase